MPARTRSAVTLSVLALLLLVAALWGWQAATAPLPGKVDTALCVQRTIDAGEKVYPQDVTVSVYNAGTREGLAARVMQSFNDAGFPEGNSGNATSARVPNVQIWSTEPKSPAVLLVASRLGGDVDVERRDGPGVGVSVIVGDGFTKLTKGPAGVVAQEDVEICSPTVD